MGFNIDRIWGLLVHIYKTFLGKIPKISPGAYIFQRLFLRGLYIQRGLSTGGNLRLKIDWASLIVERKFIILLCFPLYLRAIFQFQATRGLIFGGGGGGDLTEGFLHYQFGGLIFGGAYFQIFTVFKQTT